MALFKRKPKTDAVGMPPELQDYYQAENRDRTWMAWVLGLGTLIVTVLIALGLFYGGRWAYRKIRNQPANVATNQNQNQNTQNAVDNQSGSENNDSEGDTNNNASNPAPAQGSNPTNPATPPTTGTSSTSTSTPNNTASSMPATADLPNTGPADTLAIFIGATVLAYVVHRRLLSN